MGSSRTRARTRVPCIGRRILNHRTTREALSHLILFLAFLTLWPTVFVLWSAWSSSAWPSSLGAGGGWGLSYSLLYPQCLAFRGSRNLEEALLNWWFYVRRMKWDQSCQNTLKSCTASAWWWAVSTDLYGAKFLSSKPVCKLAMRRWRLREAKWLAQGHKESHRDRVGFDAGPSSRPHWGAPEVSRPSSLFPQMNICRPPPVYRPRGSQESAGENTDQFLTWRDDHGAGEGNTSQSTTVTSAQLCLFPVLCGDRVGPRPAGRAFLSWSSLWGDFSEVRKSSRDCPGGPVVKTPHFQRRGRGHGFDPWSGN